MTRRHLQNHDAASKLRFIFWVGSLLLAAALMQIFQAVVNATIPSSITISLSISWFAIGALMVGLSWRFEFD